MSDNRITFQRKDGTTFIKKDPFKAQREVAFFLRIHGHLPDNVCGESPLAPCEYRKDGKPINRRNDYVDELRKNAAYCEKEKQVLDAQENGVAIRSIK